MAGFFVSALVTISVRGGPNQPNWLSYVNNGALLAAIVAAVATCLVVRCPKCGARWVWMSVSQHNITTWLSWLHSLDECPKCGFGSPKDASSGADLF